MGLFSTVFLRVSRVFWVPSKGMRVFRIGFLDGFLDEFLMGFLGFLGVFCFFFSRVF